MHITIFNNANGIYYSDRPILATSFPTSWCNSTALCGSSEDLNGFVGTFTFLINTCADKLYFAVNTSDSSQGFLIGIDVESDGSNDAGTI